MPRDLSDKDISILKKLAPEFSGSACPGSGHMFHSILPPVSNHFAADGRDFAERIARLSDEDVRYLADLIITGEESMGCLPEEDLDSFLALVRTRLSDEMAKNVIRAFAASGSCSNE
jgi:hypothetical protein